MSESITSKTCKRCGDTKPLADFSHSTKENRDGYSGVCRSCTRARKKAWAEENRDHVRAYHREWSGLNQDKTKATRAKRADKKAEYDVRYVAENRERRAAVGLAWQRNNRERWYAYVSKWRAAHPEHVSARRAARRALVAGAEGSHTQDDIRRQREAQGDACYYCGTSLSDGMHVDHMMPLALGGSNGPENIVCACPTCNLRKGAKHPERFLSEMLHALR